MQFHVSDRFLSLQDCARSQASERLGCFRHIDCCTNPRIKGSTIQKRPVPVWIHAICTKTAAVLSSILLNLRRCKIQQTLRGEGAIPFRLKTSLLCLLRFTSPGEGSPESSSPAIRRAEEGDMISLLNINPSQLEFLFEADRELKSALNIRNVHDEIRAAFKIKVQRIRTQLAPQQLRQITAEYTSALPY